MKAPSLRVSAGALVCAIVLGAAACSSDGTSHGAPGARDGAVGGGEDAPPATSAVSHGDGTAPAQADAAPVLDSDWDAACDDLAAAFCEHAASCSPQRVATSFVTTENCEATNAVRCRALVDLPGVDRDPSGVRDAMAAMKALPCNDPASSVPAAYTARRGSTADGSSCDASEQCASGTCLGCRCVSRPPRGSACSFEEQGCEEGAFCDLVEGSGVGTCRELPALGAPCRLACTPGAGCADGRCVPLGGLGASCEAAGPGCTWQYVCVSGVCSDPALLPGNPAGAPCEGYPSAGSCGSGLACHYPAGVDLGFYDGSGHCSPPSQLGESCGRDEDCAVFLRCASGRCSGSSLSRACSAP